MEKVTATLLHTTVRFLYLWIKTFQSPVKIDRGYMRAKQRFIDAKKGSSLNIAWILFNFVQTSALYFDEKFLRFYRMLREREVLELHTPQEGDGCQFCGSHYDPGGGGQPLDRGGTYLWHWLLSWVLCTLPKLDGAKLKWKWEKVPVAFIRENSSK